MLVVEDEPFLRLAAADIANDAGLGAVEACDADEALSILEGRDDICLVFTDVQMPGSMDGFGLACLVRRRWPQMAIIITSGCACPTTEALPSDATFVPKPYEPGFLIPAFRKAAASCP